MIHQGLFLLFCSALFISGPSTAEDEKAPPTEDHLQYRQFPPYIPGSPAARFGATPFGQQQPHFNNEHGPMGGFRQGFGGPIYRGHDCCNVEIINIFHQMDLESRYRCYKLTGISHQSIEEQSMNKACVAECIAKERRYMTSDGVVYKGELMNNLVAAFRVLPWVPPILEDIVDGCIERAQSQTNVASRCKTEALEVGICIGRKLQYECFEKHLHNEDSCNQKLFDTKFVHCVPQSPGYGCDTIR